QNQVAPLDKWDPGKACGSEHHRQGAPAEEIEEIRAVITRWLQEERILAKKTISPGASGQQGVGGFGVRVAREHVEPISLARGNAGEVSRVEQTLFGPMAQSYQFRCGERLPLH